MNKLDQFLELLVDIVNDDSSSWREKRDAIAEACSDDGERQTAINEFITWFDKDDN